MIDRVIRNQLF